jgi:hypothetical protein
MWRFCLIQERGNKQQLNNFNGITNAYGQYHCSAFLVLHAYTGCDTASAFKGIGKVKAIEVLLQNQRFVETIAHLADTWTVSEQIQSQS